MKDWNELKNRAYKNACEHGFHDEEWSDEHLLCLVVCELMEAVQAHRKGRMADKKMFESLMNTANEIIPKDDLNEKFKIEYECCIKGSVEEELADACIRLLDLAGLRGYYIQDIEGIHYILSRDNKFTENVFYITNNLFNYDFEIRSKIVFTLSGILELAYILRFDLMWFIETKMKYNEMRPYKHGCKY